MISECVVCGKTYEKMRVWQKFCSAICRWQYWDKKKDPIKKKDYQKTRNLHRHYGLSREKYDEMLKEQKGKCKLCQYAPSLHERGLSVDHCHKEKKVRALLCGNCNRVIIGSVEKVGLDKIADYLGYVIVKKGPQ
jgi:hypothetical protein